MGIKYYTALDGPVAYRYLVRAVPTRRTLTHQHSERLRCEWHAFPCNWRRLISR